MTRPTLTKRATSVRSLPAGAARFVSADRSTPAAHTSKGQRTLITGSALALDKKGA